MPRTVKRLLGAGMVAAAAYAVWRAFDARRTDSNVTWEPQPFPYPPVPHARSEPTSVDQHGDRELTQPREAGDDRADRATDAGGDAGADVPAWVEPVDGACPATHPVKAKLSSGIFHVPGGANYVRTRPDRCYADIGAAEADGLRAAKA